MPGPGFEPGLLRPQRSVLTTRRSRLTTLLTADVRGKIISLSSNNVFWVLYGESSLLTNLTFAVKKKLFLGMFKKIRSYSKKIYLVGNFHTPWTFALFFYKNVVFLPIFVLKYAAVQTIISLSSNNAFRILREKRQILFKVCNDKTSLGDISEIYT